MHFLKRLEVPVQQPLYVPGDQKSGKNVIAELIAGIAAPTKGKVYVDDYSATSLQAVAQVGYAPCICPIAPALTLAEALGFMADLRGLNETDVELALEEAEMDNNNADRLIGALGELDKKRASIAYALLGAPKYLVLDRIVEGLNETEEQKLLDLLGELKDKYSFIYVSDTFEDARALCSEAVLLSNGKIVASGDFDSVLYPDKTVQDLKARVRGDKELIKQLLGDAHFISKFKISITSTGTAIIDVTVQGEGSEETLRELFTDASIKVLEIKRVNSAAENVLVALFERQEEKEEQRRVAREEKTEIVKLTAELINQTLRDSDEDEEELEDEADEDVDDQPILTEHPDVSENAYRVKLTEDFIAQALREADDDADDEDSQTEGE